MLDEGEACLNVCNDSLSYGLGIHGIYVSSSIVDEGTLIKNKSSIRLRVNSFQVGSSRLI